MFDLNAPITPVQTVRERIKQRRHQMLIHSCLYYGCDTSVVDDDTWQRWANELRDLQLVYGDKIGFYDKEFQDWDGTTGHHLPQDLYIMTKAGEVLANANLTTDNRRRT